MNAATGVLVAAARAESDCSCVLDHTGYPCPVLPSGWDQLAEVARLIDDEGWAWFISGMMSRAAMRGAP